MPKPTYQRDELLKMLKSPRILDREKSAIRWALTTIDVLRKVEEPEPNPIIRTPTQVDYPGPGPYFDNFHPDMADQ